MKWVGLYLLIWLGMAARLCAQQDETLWTGTPTRVTVPTNLWFAIGEELVYRIYWGKLPVGVTRITTSWTNQGSTQKIIIRYRTYSNKIIDTIYPVNDLIETIIDPESFLPVSFTKILNEGHRKVHEVTHFDFTNRVAHWESLKSGKKRTFTLEPDTRDLVSFMYLLRTFSFTVSETNYFRVMSDKKIYDLWVKVAARENVVLPNYGEVTSLKLEPEAAFEGIFVRKGKITAWISDDSRRICTRMVGSVPIASINVLLWEVHGPGNDKWTRVTQSKIKNGTLIVIKDPADPVSD